VAKTIRQRIASWIGGETKKAPGRRMYAAARPGRNTSGYGGTSSSADAELSTSLSRLRNASRQMVRDSAYAKRAKHIITNNVIGSGVGMQAQVSSTRGTLRKDVNDAIEYAWLSWASADSCHTGGTLHFHDLERAAMGQVFEAGEVFIRMHMQRFGGSRVPLGLELIEAERIPDSIVEPGSSQGEVRMGIEVDDFGRPIAYWVRQRHPGDVRSKAGSSERYERVPAEQMFHLRIVDRWPQTRGEPWMHAVLRKIDDLNELTSAELQAVRASSYYFATIQTPEGDNPTANAKDDLGQNVMDLEPLTVSQLAPGETFDFHAPNRPNAELDAFIRHIVREMATGALCSYESLSRDYSQSNYSSSRLALLDDRDTWRMLQQWWIRSFRMPLHKRWLMQAVLSRAVESVPMQEFGADMEKFSAVLFKPRGWSWIDPTKEVEAYKEAIKAGLTTLTDVIAETANGRDIEDVISTRRRELDLLEEADIDVDTTVEDPEELAAAKAGVPEPEEPTDTEDSASRVLSMRRKQG
jgi:lambda family phage portal protein